MAPADLQIWAASTLITALEKILSDHLIKDDLRAARLRNLINDASKAFQIPTIAEGRRPAETPRPIIRKSEMRVHGEG